LDVPPDSFFLGADGGRGSVEGILFDIRHGTGVAEETDDEREFRFRVLDELVMGGIVFRVGVGGGQEMEGVPGGVDGSDEPKADPPALGAVDEADETPIQDVPKMV
jgi:hypothetical protein